jgi:hypothetical protein
MVPHTSVRPFQQHLKTAQSKTKFRQALDKEKLHYYTYVWLSVWFDVCAWLMGLIWVQINRRILR